MDKQGTWQMCERIREKIEGLSFNTDGKESIHITVSMGIFHKSSKDNMTGSEIIQKSDENLYQAKANGRNRVEMN
ncbi:MAG: diguanylate cyclase [Desulfosporosinus sp.]|nr:diguanylate cyclase [Desulfosporosinus sp.]